MTKEEMREMQPAELQSEATKLEAKIWKMRFQARGEPVENSGLLNVLKKERARMLTILRQKQLAGEASGEVPVDSSRADSSGADSSGADSSGAGSDETNEDAGSGNEE